MSQIVEEQDNYVDNSEENSEEMPVKEDEFPEELSSGQTIELVTDEIEEDYTTDPALPNKTQIPVDNTALYDLDEEPLIIARLTDPAQNNIVYTDQPLDEGDDDDQYSQVSFSNQELEGAQEDDNDDITSGDYTVYKKKKVRLADADKEEEDNIIEPDIRQTLTRQDRRKLAITRSKIISELPQKETTGNSYGFYDDDLLDIAVVEVTQKLSKNNVLNSRTVNDNRMGSIDGPCGHCFAEMGVCPGHLGVIKLKRYYMGDFQGKIAAQIMNSICISCGNLLATMNELRKFWYYKNKSDRKDWKPWNPSKPIIWKKVSKYSRLAKIEAIIVSKKKADPALKCTNTSIIDDNGKRKKIVCNHNANLMFNYENGGLIMTVGKKQKNKLVQSLRIEPEQIRMALERINEFDALAMGIMAPSHPKKLVQKYQVVPPVCIRARHDDKHGLHPITSSLNNVVGNNIIIAEKFLANGWSGDDFPFVGENVSLGPKISDRSENEENEENEEEEEEMVFIPKLDDYGFPIIPEAILKATIPDKVDSRHPDQKRAPIPDKAFADAMKYLRTEIVKLYFGDKVNINGKKYKSIKDELQSKESHFRQHMTGKRADQGGRTVLSPGPWLEFGEIGLPRTWSKVLSFPVLVTPQNLKVIQQLLVQGKIKRIRTNQHSETFDIVNENNIASLDIVPGNVVDRDLFEGDFVAFNRNPSLHKFSIMGYKVRFHDELGIHLNILTSAHHNFDFDGDEGNVLLPLTIEAVAELQTVMYSRHMLISGQDNRPLTGFLMNDSTAAYVLTEKQTTIHKHTWNDCIKILHRPARGAIPTQLATLFERGARVGTKKLSGRLLFSALLPADFYYDDGKVNIIDGVLVTELDAVRESTPISKQQGGPSHRSILQQMVKMYGEERAGMYLSDAQFLLKRWLEDNPISFTGSDILPKLTKEEKVIFLYSITQPANLKYKSLAISSKLLLERSEYVDFDHIGEVINNGYYLISSIMPATLNVTINDKTIVADGVLVAEIRDKKEAKQYHKAVLAQMHKDFYPKRGLDYLHDLRSIMILLGLPQESGKHFEMVQLETEKVKRSFEKKAEDLEDPKRRDATLASLNPVVSNISQIGKKTLEENLDKKSNMYLISNLAGTKGNAENMANIVVGLGMQYVGTEIINSSNNMYKAPGDVDPMHFGHVSGSFYRGLNPLESFFHGMSGREGLTDTAIKTAEPGALARELSYHFMNSKTDKDGYVVAGGREILQLTYGYSGFNPEKLIKVKFDDGDVPFFTDVETVLNTVNSIYFDSQAFDKIDVMSFAEWQNSRLIK